MKIPQVKHETLHLEVRTDRGELYGGAGGCLCESCNSLKIKVLTIGEWEKMSVCESCLEAALVMIRPVRAPYEKK